MKTSLKVMVVAVATMVSGAVSLAQTTVTPGLDLYSTYLWRGSKIDGPSAQPSLVVKNGGLTVGTWGSFGLASSYSEIDFYVSYAFEFGLSLGVTDYYYPTLNADGYSAFEFSKDSGAHAIEANVGYTLDKFTLSANYIFNEAAAAASTGGDKYFEASYAFESFSLFVGAGDGWHTKDTKFALCNIGAKATKEIKVSDSFSIPVTGVLMINPDKELISLGVGISF
ncbi:MAG TPA: hypothetical protein PK252_01150 [Bacteroidales bacterium]|nr:hypothetical protein [Bacteroidales bacterium]